MKVHRFEQSHRWEQEQAGFLAALWAAWWPECSRTAVQDLQAQRSGIDATLSGWVMEGVAFSCDVEEKVRDKDYGDVLLELVSDDVRGRPGWAVKGAESKLLLYAIRSTRRGWVFPMQTVQAVTRARRDEWQRRYGTRVARNATYRSINVPVPLREFVHAVDQEHGIVLCPACRMICDWSDLRGPSWCSMCRREAPFEIKV